MSVEATQAPVAPLAYQVPAYIETMVNSALVAGKDKSDIIDGFIQDGTLHEDGLLAFIAYRHQELIDRANLTASPLKEQLREEAMEYRYALENPTKQYLMAMNRASEIRQQADFASALFEGNYQLSENLDDANRLYAGSNAWLAVADAVRNQTPPRI
jgi:hypothetical protein